MRLPARSQPSPSSQPAGQLAPVPHASGPSQVTSQAHELSQRTRSQLRRPPQVTEQSPLGHVTSSQVSLPPQVTPHELEVLQSTWVQLAAP